MNYLDSKLIAYAFRLTPHADLKQEISHFTQRHQVLAGTVLSIVGSLEEVHLRYANQEAGTQIIGHHEILSLQGTFSLEGIHLHLAVANKHGNVLGGHLLDGNLIHTTAEIIVGVLPSLHFSRTLDTTYQYRELHVRKLSDEV